MKKALIVVAVIAGFMSWSVLSHATGIGFIEVACSNNTTGQIVSAASDFNDFWVTKGAVDASTWRISVVGKMVSGKKFSNYYKYVPATAIFNGPSTPENSSFNGTIYEGSTVKKAVEFVCLANTQDIFWCYSGTLTAADLPAGATLKLTVRDPNDQAHCDSVGPAAIKSDANNNYIPDDVTTDYDADGVKDGVDNCFLKKGPASKNGCPIDDADGDGVVDSADICAGTPALASVNSVGCPDTDGDGVFDNLDTCASTPTGTTVDAAGCPVAEADSDEDGVLNSADNCPDNSNIDQADVDGDGMGDVCDTDGVTPADVTPPATTASEGGGCSLVPDKRR